MSSETLAKSRQIEWPVAIFLVLNPLFAVIGLGICAVHGNLGHLWIWLFAMVYAGATNLSITAGYHRLFAHRSYEAHPWVEWVFLMIGVSAYQGTCLKWSSDHRRHHAEVDQEGDPYSIQKGFWYAHLGWLFFKESVNKPIVRAADLEKNKRVAFQHKHFLLLSILMGFLLPAAVGAMLGSAFAGIVIAGSLRIFLTQQSTFFVNSLCHTLGRQTYSKKVSARDSFFVALLTHGEGYHNFHHTFQLDYRNGVNWYHWDPTKWTILCLKWLGLAEKLRTIPAAEILKARLQMEAQRLTLMGYSHERIEQMKAKIIEAQVRFRQMKEEYANLKLHAKEDAQAKIAHLRLEIKLAQIEFRYALESWQLTLQACPSA